MTVKIASRRHAAGPFCLRIAFCRFAAEERVRRAGAARQANETRPEDRDFRRRLFLGRRGCVQPYARRDQRGFWLSRRQRGHGQLYARSAAAPPSHAEAVRVTYDPRSCVTTSCCRSSSRSSPTRRLHNRQGPDRGPQYRARSFRMTAEQRAVAQAYLRQMGRPACGTSRSRSRSRTTARFYPGGRLPPGLHAEEPEPAAISVRWDAPKVAALKANFPQLYRARFRTG